MTPSRHFYAITGLATVLAASSLAAPRATVALATNPQAVSVVNPNSSPVPTSAQGTTQVGGTVAVSSLPAVQIGSGQTVGISGTPNVAVTSMPNVQITGTPNVAVTSMPQVQLVDGTGVAINNTTSDPVHVKDQSSLRTPVNVDQIVNLADGVALTTPDIYTVPVGKRLIILTIYALAAVPVGESIDYAKVGVMPIHLSDPRGPVSFILDRNEQDATIAAQSLWSANSHIQVAFSRDVTTGSATVECGFTGYLEDVP